MYYTITEIRDGVGRVGHLKGRYRYLTVIVTLLYNYKQMIY